MKRKGERIMMTEKPKRIPTRPGKPMFRYYLKILVDKDDFGAIQPFIDLAKANLFLACECLQSYASGSKQKKREILDKIPGYIERVENSEF